LRARLLPAQLADATTVELAGTNLVSLTVERQDASEAERLVSAIARQAVRAVRVLAKDASETVLADIEQIEKEKRQVEGNYKEFQRQLSQLMTDHPFETGTHGGVVSSSRRRLGGVQQALTKARRELLEVDAEIVSLRVRLSPEAGTKGSPDDAASRETPAAARLRRRIESLDDDIVALRKNFTDLHPRVAKLRTERARMVAELSAANAVPVNEPVRVLEAQVRQQLLNREGERARLASRVEQFEKEEAELAEYVKTEASVVEDRARKLAVHLKETAKSLETEQQRVEDARLAAKRSSASRGSITVRSNPPPTQVIRSGVSGDVASAIGAVAGLILGAFLAAFAEALNPIIRSSEDIRRHLDLPVLATVPAAVLVSAPMVRRRGSGVVGSLVWLLVFLLVAALLLALVYPGWDQLKILLSQRASCPAPSAMEVKS